MTYTLAVTSCNRPALLQRTLDSFIDYAGILPAATVILEDSDAPKPEWLGGWRYKALGKGTWKTNFQRRGQMYSLDRLYDEIETEYVFHLEDDWQFERGGFMQQSFDILQAFPKISAASLRGKDCNGHPLQRDPIHPFQIQQPGWQGGWGGYSFNPGLRRMSDLKHLGGSFGRHVGYARCGCAPELQISRTMLEKGFRIAAPWDKPHIKHLGEGISRAVEKLPAPPRVLLAVPVTRRYDYGTHTSGVNRLTDGRIESVRDTWFRDVAAFPNVDARFFYGRPVTRWPETETYIVEHAKPDEIFLDCPDDYTHLPEKIKAICAYAVANGYDYLIKSDDDTALHIDRLMRSGFDRVDQMGYFAHCRHQPGVKCSCYVTGMCYTLSRRAMELVANTPLLKPEESCWHWAEDYWVGKILREAGIKPTAGNGWVTGGTQHYAQLPFPRGTVAAHSITPEDMRKWYASI